jgi:hypothetical protein
LVLNGSTISYQPLIDAALKREVPLTIFEDGSSEVYDLYQANLVLVRPDQYIAWRGDILPDNSVNLIDKVVGRA